MGTSVLGNEQVIGYKYRTPLQAEYLAYISGHLTNPGLSSLPEITVSSNTYSIGKFSCFLHYSDATADVRTEQLIKVVFKGTITGTLDSTVVAIGVQFRYKAESAATPSVDWYADVQTLTAANVADFKGIIVATVVHQGTTYYVSTNGAEFSDCLLLELGYNPNCWLSVQNPRENPSGFYKNLVTRKHNTTKAAVSVSSLGVSSAGSTLDMSNAAAGKTHFIGFNAKTNALAVVSQKDGDTTECTFSAATYSSVIGRVFIPANAQIKLLGTFTNAGITTTKIETFNLIQSQDSILLAGDDDQILTSQDDVPTWSDTFSDTCYGVTTAKKRVPNIASIQSTFASYTKDSNSAAAAGSSGTGLMTERAVYNALPKFNNAHDYNSGSSLYAPTTAGGTSYSANQVLVPGGENSAPVWSSTPTLTSVTTTSSRDKKEQIKPYKDSALDLLKLVEVVSFYYKKSEGDNEPHVGFIAEDTHPLLSGTSQDRMRHADCIGLLIKAVQELNNRIERLENGTK